MGANLDFICSKYQSGVKLNSLGKTTAYDFAKQSSDWVRLTFNNIVIERTWRELNGEDCIPDQETTKKKSISTSRSFNGMIEDFESLRTHVSNFAVLKKLYRPGYKYKKAGVIVMGIGPNSPIQHDFRSTNLTTRWSDIIRLK